MKNFYFIAFCSLLVSTPVLSHRSNKTKLHKSAPIIITSVPKAGTHLLAKTIHLLSNKELMNAPTLSAIYQRELNNLTSKHFYITHAPCSPQNYQVAHNNNSKVILILRDPRDVLISYVHWLKKHYAMDPNLGNGIFPGWQNYGRWSTEEMIAQFIKVYPTKSPEVAECTTIAEFYNLYLPWKNYPNALITSFEKLVGPQGGGDTITQENEIKKIAQFLNIRLDGAKFNALCSQLFGATGTFREGRIGSWKNTLTDEHKKALKAMPGFNELLINLNYEKDELW